jgi:hypothetical protein
MHRQLIVCRLNKYGRKAGAIITGEAKVGEPLKEKRSLNIEIVR